MVKRRIRRWATGAIGGMALWATTASPVMADEPDWIQRPVVVLQGLDKVTARISTVTAPVGQTVSFGTLKISPRTCQEHPPTLAPESAAFLEIDDQPPDESPNRVFTGWMFASSPGLNALEHPVYDVWVLSCSSETTAGQSSTSGKN